MIGYSKVLTMENIYVDHTVSFREMKGQGNINPVHFYTHLIDSAFMSSIFLLFITIF
jgi:hypothetical protein